MLKVRRYSKNPILKPNPHQAWEKEGAFNGCPVKIGKKIFLLYRAVSVSHYHAAANTEFKVSDIGIAESNDGKFFKNRAKFIVPEELWEKFGCEDPKVTKLDGKYYIFYTALSKYPFDASGIKVGLAISPDLKKIEKKHLITPFNAKAMALFPERIDGKLWAILTPNTDTPPSHIALARFSSMNEMLDKNYWEKWYSRLYEHSLKLQRNPDDQVELGAPPIKTKQGWLIIYSHIRKYYSAQKIFGVEAALLSLKNPSVIIAKTYMPIMLPEEAYELYGAVPNVIFPTGALIHGQELFIYYGAADTTCAIASVKLSDLVNYILTASRDVQIKFTRAKENPILEPIKSHSWEAQAVFNPAAVYEAGKVHMIYRAMSEDNISVLGYASSKDGIHFDERLDMPIYVPREVFEMKRNPGGNSGCEDPRITKIGELFYMCYTAFDGQNPPRVALTSISVKNFLAKKWEWTKPVLISPPECDDKDAAVFPGKVGGKYLIFHRMGNDIDINLSSRLDFSGETWLEETIWLERRVGLWDSRKVGIAAPPIETKSGWILLYHGVSDTSGKYRIGAALLDLKNPVKILARADYPVFEPDADYEKAGIVPNVVFPCGAVLIGKTIFMYYGGADQVIGVATVNVRELLKLLR